MGKLRNVQIWFSIVFCSLKIVAASSHSTPDSIAEWMIGIRRSVTSIALNLPIFALLSEEKPAKNAVNQSDPSLQRSASDTRAWLSGVQDQRVCQVQLLAHAPTLTTLNRI
jgi:hypothetical protein